MRILVNILIGIMPIVVIAGVIWHYRQNETRNATILQVRQSLSELHHQASFFGALGTVETSLTGYPLQIDPNWFDPAPPANVLLQGERPWVDVAPDLDEHQHPPDPVVISPGQAQFWYNPTLGIFRARVPAQVTEAKTLELYNHVNMTSMSQLPRYARISPVRTEENPPVAVEAIQKPVMTQPVVSVTPAEKSSRPSVEKSSLRETKPANASTTENTASKQMFLAPPSRARTAEADESHN